MMDGDEIKADDGLLAFDDGVENAQVVEVAQDMRSGSDAEQWIKRKLGLLPKTSLGWFRAGVGFYNKKQYALSIQCFQRSVNLDPKNYNAFQIMARACIAVNRREDAILALKESVKLDNPSDWQLLVELTGQVDAENAEAKAQASAAAATAKAS